MSSYRIAHGSAHAAAFQWQVHGYSPILAHTASLYSSVTWITIKNKKIRIAVLYTQYDGSGLHSTNSWYDSWVHPYNGTPSQIESNLQSCASPGLYTEVQTGGDITGALQALFLKVASDPRLTQ